MTREAKELQQQAIKELAQLLAQKNTITFKAPTGSGKTYIMAAFMNRVLASDSDVVFIVSSLSKGGLAGQNYESFVRFSGQFHTLRPYLISSESSSEEGVFINQGHNVYVLARDLYKEKSKLKAGAFVEFLRGLCGYNGFQAYKPKKIYLIKDECHIATSNLDSLIKEKGGEYFDKVINFSATPNEKKKQIADVEITEIQAVQANLIKAVEWQEDEWDNEKGLKNALHTFMGLKKAYLESIGINPCFIIQISNKDKAKEELGLIKQILKNDEFKDLKWMYIADKENESNDALDKKGLAPKKWKDFAKENTSTIDVIIFKMVITEGFDIPRACMLYQMRNSQSKQLDEQVIGRVRRNPKLLDFVSLKKEAQELITKAYVYGIKPKESQSVGARLKGYHQGLFNTISAEFKLKTTKIDTQELKRQSGFDIAQILENQKESVARPSIFELYARIENLGEELGNECRAYIKNVRDFFALSANIEAVKKEFSKLNSGKPIVSEVVEVLPVQSVFTKSDYAKDIASWIWENEGEFCFDSVAEKKWFEFLWDSVRDIDAPENDRGDESKRLIQRVKISGEYVYLLGKNLLPHSLLKFEYFSDGIHSSYPDFILKDWAGRFHIFEVKSLLSSSNNTLDKNEYEDKIRALKKCYKEASGLTEYHFYIPILQDSSATQNAMWEIDYFYKGKEEHIKKEDVLTKIKEL